MLTEWYWSCSSKYAEVRLGPLALFVFLAVSQCGQASCFSAGWKRILASSELARPEREFNFCTKACRLQPFSLYLYFLPCHDRHGVAQRCDGRLGLRPRSRDKSGHQGIHQERDGVYQEVLRQSEYSYRGKKSSMSYACPVQLTNVSLFAGWGGFSLTVRRL